MPGRDGGKRITVRNLEVVQIDLEKNLLVLKGAVPGSRNGYLLIKKQNSGGNNG
jgi:large subunit ribosomal protein L3